MSIFTAAPMPHIAMMMGVSTRKMISQQQQQSRTKVLHPTTQGPANAPPTAARPTHKSSTPTASTRKRGMRMTMMMPISTCCQRGKFYALNKPLITSGTVDKCLPGRCRWPNRIDSVSPPSKPDTHSKTSTYRDKSYDCTPPSSQ